MIALAALLLATQASPNPFCLPIGRKGTVAIAPGELLALGSGRAATLDDVVRAAAGKPYLFFGEEHASAPAQRMEADLIAALAKAGRRVTVGVEMFTRPKQDVLDAWSAGRLSEAEFLARSDWAHEWGYDYADYRPVFEAVRRLKLPLVALNVPRAWVEAVARRGFDSLPTSARLQLPPHLYLGNAAHRAVFDALMGGHPMGKDGPDPEFIYQAQVLWDEGMADTAMKFRALRPAAPADLFLVIAGSGHSMYGQGIDDRIARRRGGGGPTVEVVPSGTAKLARGLGDFAFELP